MGKDKGTYSAETCLMMEKENGEKMWRDITSRTCKNQQLINLYNTYKRNKDPLLAWCMEQCPLTFHQWVKVASVAYI